MTIRSAPTIRVFHHPVTLRKSPTRRHIHFHTVSITHCEAGTEGHHIYFWIQTLHHRSPEPSHKPCSPTPLSSTPGLLTQRSACSIFPSRVTAGLAGLMLATARLVLDCRVSRAAPICLAKARASGLSPLPLRWEHREGEDFKIGKAKALIMNLKMIYVRHQFKGKHHSQSLMPRPAISPNTQRRMSDFQIEAWFQDHHHSSNRSLQSLHMTL